MEDKKRVEKGANHFTLVGGGFDRQENLHRMTVLVTDKQISSLAQENLTSLYRGSMGFIFVVSPDDLDNTMLSPGCILELAPGVGTVDRTYIPKTGSR